MNVPETVPAVTDKLLLTELTGSASMPPVVLVPPTISREAASDDPAVFCTNDEPTAPTAVPLPRILAPLVPETVKLP